ncbi:hypothetical protein OHD16_15690 [Sphingobacterium sp. ML3W]|uniref:hypothetical protein n=1 Tax=Sphingobacterium sp. ML3W TaxID=1538644 RepID=UPI002499C499|nr:hypothetical protein [Sphingobacterium sp. ML3W]WFA81397.1 hypothetical protein OGI71_08830 [Sphingobacterium sp. ML3W]
MNWTNFLVTLTFSYLAYYGLNLLYDLFISDKGSSSTTTEDTLIFEESIQPQLIEYAPPSLMADETSEKETIQTINSQKNARQATGNLISTGAVGIRELFNLAKNNLIEHTSTIPY